MNFLNIGLQNIYPLLSMIFMLFLGVLVFSKNFHSSLNRLFFAVTVVFAMWQFGTFMMFLNTTDDAIIFWDRFIYLGVVFMPALQYHFGLVFTYTTEKRRIFLYVAYALSFVFLLCNQSNLFVYDVFRYKWGVHTLAGPLHHFFLLFFFAYIFGLLNVFLKGYRDARNRIERYRFILLIVAFAILNLVGGMGYLAAYRIPVYPIFLMAPVVFSVIIAYLIVTHHLMDIKLVARNYIVQFSSLGVIVGFAGLAKYVVYLMNVSAGSLLFVDFLVLVSAISLYPVLRLRFYYFANKYLFSSLYDPRKVIAGLSDKLRSTLEIKSIYRYISSTLTDAFHTSKVAVLIFDEKAGVYQIRYNEGFDFERRKTITIDHDIHKFFIVHDDPEDINELERLVPLKERAVVQELDDLGVVIINPLNIKDKAVGLIMMGAKESGDVYNKEDFEVLSVIGTQSAIALENALLYDETKKFTIVLEKKVNEATEKLREQNEELKKLDVMKTEFVSIASHQLRTPLTATRWALEYLNDTLRKKLNKEQQESFDELSSVNTRLIKLVNELLNISRIEDGRLRIEPKPTDLVQMVKIAVKDMAPLIKQRKLKLKEKYEKLSPINLDENVVSKAVANFISNAVKYNREGKSVWVEVKKEGKEAIITMQDEGIGIPKEEQKHIFEKFYRASNAVGSNTEGTGLGMYIAKNAIDISGGRVWFESVEGTGTTFCVALPLAGSKAIAGEKGLA